MSEEVSGFRITKLTTGQAEGGLDVVQTRVAELSRGLFAAICELPEGDTLVPDIYTRFEPVDGLCFPASVACALGSDDGSVEITEEDLVDALTRKGFMLRGGVSTPDSRELEGVNDALRQVIGGDIEGLVDLVPGFRKFEQPYTLGQQMGAEIRDGNPLIVTYGWTQPAQLPLSWGIVTGAHRDPQFSRIRSWVNLYRTSQGRMQRVSCDGLAQEVMGHIPAISSATVLSLRRSPKAETGFVAHGATLR